jgi:hypothetical protein
MGLLVMLPTIQLDYQLPLKTDEIDDIGTNGFLPAEFDSG